MAGVNPSTNRLLDSLYRRSHMKKKMFSDHYVKVVYKSDKEVVISALKGVLYSGFGTGVILFILSRL